MQPITGGEVCQGGKTEHSAFSRLSSRAMYFCLLMHFFFFFFTNFCVSIPTTEVETHKMWVFARSGLPQCRRCPSY